MKIMLYRALVESRILYCISIWGGANQSYLGKIISLQKKAVRVVFGAPYNSHTEPLFGKIGALQFTDLYKHSLVKIGNRFVYPFKDTPKGFLECFSLQPKTCTRSGQKSNLLVPFCKNKSMERFCTYQTPLVYNSLKDIKKSCPKQSTPQAFKSFCISSYKNFICLRKNCYSCRKQFTW